MSGMLPSLDFTVWTNREVTAGVRVAAPERPETPSIWVVAVRTPASWKWTWSEARSEKTHIRADV
jgi:hypothetical protein